MGLFRGMGATLLREPIQFAIYYPSVSSTVWYTHGREHNLAEYGRRHRAQPHGRERVGNGVGNSEALAVAVSEVT